MHAETRFHLAGVPTPGPAHQRGAIVGASRRDGAADFRAGNAAARPRAGDWWLLALTATRLLRVALVGVSSNDPLTFVAIVVVLTVAAPLGCLTRLRQACA
jgi:hypothetical protein